ncbi:bifunctional (p)ppGpp synthetase/guanosine-3',5'-bis(diphosphate) 3'-pyrophosphohydrolase [bacterium]|nr:bifunctional (p)ppGpp synthetase/guanosine-3',5'-bis(diphosphate) 3'-pyrophosphohydrolase [bacterium]
MTAIATEALINTMGKYASPEEIDLVGRAYEFARAEHEGQFRKSEEPYIIHPYEVALILAQLEADGATVAAGLLHDVLEDTEVTPDELAKMFGREVCKLVEGVTKLEKLKFSSKEERQAENFRRMFVAMAKDVRVILIKLADRLHNMRTLKHMRAEKQQEISKETLEIFAPLAHRLGMGKIKWELEDMSLRYLHPDDYYKIAQFLGEKRDERERYIQEIVGSIEEELGRVGIKDADVYGRPKHFYSIFQKMRNQSKEFSDIFDITAIRVLVDNIKECYEVLGVVHSLWRPIPGRFKDYVAMPKPNLYQSLHTTVIGPGGKPVEVQIRTFEMHRVAEYGIAAHWRYKEGGSALTEADQKLSWLKQLLDWQGDAKNSQEFVETVKEDLQAEEVFVFSPRGDVIDLPSGATPVDFAYRVHTEVGNRCIGAKVNGRIVTLDHHLKNGDIVEILTTKHGHPSLDWLNFVATSSTKNKIRSWFRKQRRDENIALGREALERELGRTGLEQLLKGDKLLGIAQKLNYKEVDDLIAAIGYGEKTSVQVANQIRAEFAPPEPEITAETFKAKPVPTKARNGTGILVDGEAGMQLQIAKCCSPVPGEPIMGTVTRGRGISIHSTECPNLLAVEPERRLNVSWSGVSASASYPVEIAVEVIDRVGVLKDITIRIADIKTNIRTVKVRQARDKIVIITLIIDVLDMAHLQKVIATLSRIPDVLQAYRVAKSQKSRPVNKK